MILFLPQTYSHVLTFLDFLPTWWKFCLKTFHRLRVSDVLTLLFVRRYSEITDIIFHYYSCYTAKSSWPRFFCCNTGTFTVICVLLWHDARFIHIVFIVWHTEQQHSLELSLDSYSRVHWLICIHNMAVNNKTLISVRTPVLTDQR